MGKGKFITFEGPEGSGKSTHSKSLVDVLKGRGHEVVNVREPGGTLMGEKVRELLKDVDLGEPITAAAELLLFEASRAQLISQVIRPALEEGSIVVCDRFVDSSTAYQGFARGFDVEDVIAVNDFAVSGVMPDLTILLDVSVEEGFERIGTRESGKDRIEMAGAEFHESVRSGYLELARRWPDRIKVVDAGMSESEVNNEVMKIVDDLLKG